MKGDFTRFSNDPAKHYTDVLQQQGRVQLDADWNAQRAIDRARLRSDGTAMMGAIGVPWADPGFAILPTADGRDLTIGAGTLYVGGVQCRNDAPLAFDAQPNAPGQALPRGAAARFLFYLDVWDRHVTALQDPALRDPGLGGPDTATRIQTLWQVRVMYAQSDATGDLYGPGWAPSGTGSTGAMIAQVEPAQQGSACALPSPGGYSALSNQLYRIEIHHGTPDTATVPTFKWSRDNGIVVSAVSGISGQTITVADMGPDDTLAFAQGQVVELLRPEDELNGTAGTLLLVQTVMPDTGAVIIDAATHLPSWVATRTSWAGVLLRRWDMPGGAATAAYGGIPLQADAIPLEAGLSVSFDMTGHYQHGDYWLIPARSIPTEETGNILWTGGAQPAMGIAHRYAGLALVDLHSDGTYALVEDLRTLFEPLTGRVQPFQVRLQSTGLILTQGSSLTTDQLARGLRLTTATPLEAVSITPTSIQLLAEIPVTIGQVLATAGLPAGPNPARLVGTQPVALNCSVGILGSLIRLAPDSVAMDLLQSVLAGAVSEPLDAAFAVRADSDWSVAQDGSISLAWQSSVTDDPPITARAHQIPPAAMRQLAVALSPSAQWGQPSGDGAAGLIFNAADGSGYWAFYHVCRISASPSGAPQPSFGFGLANYTGTANPVPVVQISGPAVGNAVLTLDIVATASGLVFGYRVGTGPVTQLDFSTVPGVGQLPKSFLAGSQVGIFAAGVKGTIFRDLGWISQDGSQTALLPLGANPAVMLRVVVRLSQLRAVADGPPKLVDAAAAPSPDFQTSFQVTPPTGSYYGSTYAFFANLGAFGTGRV